MNITSSDVKAIKKAYEQAEAEEAGEAVMGVVCVVVFGFAAVYLPYVIAWGLGTFSLFFWARMFVFLPRFSSVTFAVFTLWVMFWGYGPAPTLDLGFKEYALVDTGDPGWDGPMSWLVIALAASVPVVWMIVHMEKDMRGDWGGPGDQFRPFWDSTFMSGVALLVACLPVVTYLPLIIWLGLFGAEGLAHNVQSGAEARMILFSEPIAVFGAGLQWDILWPGGFWNGAVRILLLSPVALGLMFSLWNWYESAQASKAKRARTQAKNPSASLSAGIEKAAKSVSQRRAEQSAQRKAAAKERAARKAAEAREASLSDRDLVREWAEAGTIDQVHAVELRMKRRFPNLEFPYATKDDGGRLTWIREGKMDAQSNRLFAHWIKGPYSELAEPALAARGHKRKALAADMPRNKISQHWVVQTIG